MDSKFNETWDAITRSAGAAFATVTGREFSYTVSGNQLRPSRAKRDLHRSNFEKAAPLVSSLSGPGPISNLVQGSAYVYAILTDPRISVTLPQHREASSQ